MVSIFYGKIETSPSVIVSTYSMSEVFTAYPTPVWESILTLENICSELCCFHVLYFFTMDDAAGKVIGQDGLAKSSVTSLRLVSKEMKSNVENYPWNDLRKPYFLAWDLPSRVIGSLKSWKECFHLRIMSISMLKSFNSRE